MPDLLWAYSVMIRGIIGSRNIDEALTTGKAEIQILASTRIQALLDHFEADDEEQMHKLKSLFVKELRKIDPSIQVEWE